jgi:hypothetical protein
MRNKKFEVESLRFKVDLEENLKISNHQISNLESSKNKNI